jgi:hypothetical protein
MSISVIELLLAVRTYVHHAQPRSFIQCGLQQARFGEEIGSGIVHRDVLPANATHKIVAS